MLEQMVYRYSIEDNKLSQQSKRINDHIFLAQSHEHGFLVVRMSIDIFLNGIRVYFANKYESIFPMSSPLLSDL